MAQHDLRPHFVGATRRRTTWNARRCSLGRARHDGESESLLFVVRCPACRFPLVPYVGWDDAGFRCHCPRRRAMVVRPFNAERTRQVELRAPLPVEAVPA